MKVGLKLFSVNLDTDESQLLADCAALFDGRRLLYQEKDTGARHQIILSEGCMQIRRDADVTSVTTLYKKGSGNTQILSEYGVMELDAVCEYMHVSDTLWSVVYRIESQGEVTLHRRLEWHISQFV